MKKVGTLAERTCKQPGLPGTQHAVYRYVANAPPENGNVRQKEIMIYRIVMNCMGVPPEIGLQAAEDITAGFKERPWHQNATCTWDGTKLRLQADNDYDPDGKALGYEFSDEICANTPASFDFKIELESSEELIK